MTLVSKPGHCRNLSHRQILAQQTLGATPIYELLDEKGPDHSKCFEVCVSVEGRRLLRIEACPNGVCKGAFQTSPDIAALSSLPAPWRFPTTPARDKGGSASFR